MPKTIEQMFDEKQKGIKEALKGRSKTEISIGLRWAINCAVAFLPEKLRGTKKGFKMVEKWYQEFMDLDRCYMLENMPIETTKLTPQDFIQAKAEAPAKQAEQEKVDEIQGQERMKEANRELEEATTTIPPDEIPTINE